MLRCDLAQSPSELCLAQIWVAQGHFATFLPIKTNPLVPYLQLDKQLLKQDVTAAGLDVPKGAKDPVLVVIIFCHVFLYVVSERKHCQGQNNLSSEERGGDVWRSPDLPLMADRPSSLGMT